jgi:hypothetical protein
MPTGIASQAREANAKSARKPSALFCRARIEVSASLAGAGDAGSVMARSLRFDAGERGSDWFALHGCAMLEARMAPESGFGGYGGSPRGDSTQPPLQGYGPPGGVPPLGGPMTPGSGSDVETRLPLVLSIVSTLLCCDPVLGLPALVFAIQARNARNVGAIDLARRRARTALVLSIVSLGVGFSFEVVAAIRYIAATR